MIRLIAAAVFAFAVATAAHAQKANPKDDAQKSNPDKLTKCQTLARERGFNSGVENKQTGNNMDSFVKACMEGKQK